MLQSKLIKVLISILKWQVNSSSNFASFFIVMTNNSPVNFKPIHFLILDKRIPSKSQFRDFWKNLTNSSCHFRKLKSVFLQILHQCSVPSNITPLYFFNSSITYFRQRQPIKVQIFEIFECSDQNSTKCSYQFWYDKPITLPVLHHSSLSWHITPL